MRSIIRGILTGLQLIIVLLGLLFLVSVMDAETAFQEIAGATIAAALFLLAIYMRLITPYSVKPE